MIILYIVYLNRSSILSLIFSLLYYSQLNSTSAFIQNQLIHITMKMKYVHNTTYKIIITVQVDSEVD